VECPFFDPPDASPKPVVAGRDFDFCVLAMGVGAVQPVMQAALDSATEAAKTRWANMFAHVRTMPTQAAQVWMTDSLTQLRWPASPPTLAGLDAAFDTWADMSQTIPTEHWPEPPSGPQSVAYFCGALPEAVNAKGTLDDEKHFRDPSTVAFWGNGRTSGFFQKTMLRVLPGLAGAPGTLDPKKIVGGIGPDSQGLFVKVNVYPSDRYTLTRPGSSRHRISPLDVEFSNLTIAGDWTQCGFNGGCVEAAVISGKLAAHALSAWPPLASIVGYDHP
jgi:hypothetical protein